MPYQFDVFTTQCTSVQANIHILHLSRFSTSLMSNSRPIFTLCLQYVNNVHPDIGSHYSFHALIDFKCTIHQMVLITPLMRFWQCSLWLVSYHMRLDMSVPSNTIKKHKTGHVFRILTIHRE